jgi:DNA polymerase-3 subunit epsilon
VLLHPNAVVLDTETTGLGSDAELVQIAVIDLHGEPLLDTLVRPARPIPAEATAIHGIGDAAVAGAPMFSEIYPNLAALLANRLVCIYNAAFDLRILRQCCMQAGLPPLNFPACCAMEMYARYFGQWSEWHGSYQWQRLPGGDHSAHGDALATLRLLQRMAAQTTETIKVQRVISE